MNDTQHLVGAFLFIVGFVLVLCFLFVLLAREQVRKALRNQRCGPIHVRWHPLAYWTIPSEIAFQVTFVDSTNCVQTGRCAVWFNSVRWIGDDVNYLDRRMPWFGRMLYAGLSAFLLWFGLKHLITGKLALPPILSQIYPHWTSMHRGPVLLVSLAALCFAASLFLSVLYCYHRGANPRLYTFLARGLSIVSWLFLFAGLGLDWYELDSSSNP